MRRALTLTVISVLSACTQVEGEADGDPCEALNERLSECIGALEGDFACDPDQAEALLEAPDCEALVADLDQSGKSDDTGQWSMAWVSVVSTPDEREAWELAHSAGESWALYWTVVESDGEYHVVHQPCPLQFPSANSMAWAVRARFRDEVVTVLKAPPEQATCSTPEAHVAIGRYAHLHQAEEALAEFRTLPGYVPAIESRQEGGVEVHYLVTSKCAKPYSVINNEVQVWRANDLKATILGPNEPSVYAERGCPG